MPVVRLLLLLVVLGGLTLLLLQNWSPVLPLVFLGRQTQALPLALWILLSVAAGAFSSLLIASLFKMSNYFAQNRAKRRTANGSPPPRSVSERNSQTQQYTVRQQYTTSTTQQSPSATNSDASDAIDDWSSDNTSKDDWSFEDTPIENSTQAASQTRQTYEVSPEPKTSSPSDMYSHDYREEPRDSKVGRTQSIYDADYRVITPPYGAKNTASQDEDDWGFDDDDDDISPTRK